MKDDRGLICGFIYDGSGIVLPDGQGCVADEQAGCCAVEVDAAAIGQGQGGPRLVGGVISVTESAAMTADD